MEWVISDNLGMGRFRDMRLEYLFWFWYGILSHSLALWAGLSLRGAEYVFVEYRLERLWLLLLGGIYVGWLMTDFSTNIAKSASRGLSKVVLQASLLGIIATGLMLSTFLIGASLTLTIKGSSSPTEAFWGFVFVLMGLSLHGLSASLYILPFGVLYGSVAGLVLFVFRRRDSSAREERQDYRWLGKPSLLLGFMALCVFWLPLISATMGSVAIILGVTSLWKGTPLASNERYIAGGGILLGTVGVIIAAWLRHAQSNLLP
jgi:hypothetical protein